MQNEIFNYWVINRARQIGVQWAALSAIIKIESGGKLLAQINGRPEPLIRFEGHYFDKYLSSSDQARARILGLASPKAGAIQNPVSQAERWNLLARAQLIDKQAALKATSWGIGQVMGANYHWLGFSSVNALVANARSGPKGQLDLMMRYIQRAKLVPALQALDFEEFARRYNGPFYAKHGYHVKLQKAYELNLRHLPAPLSLRDWLTLGDLGPQVKQLQLDLIDNNMELVADSDYGPSTYQAVKDFQRENGLIVDGIAGPKTRASLRRPFWHCWPVLQNC